MQKPLLKAIPVSIDKLRVLTGFLRVLHAWVALWVIVIVVLPEAFRDSGKV
ncbi:MAG: hypothetical protein R3208_10285 [Ketobacteraceae bacterium]|nr:hypothetical protein [Ketobacteraceae bacterium]